MKRSLYVLAAVCGTVGVAAFVTGCGGGGGSGTSNVDLYGTVSAPEGTTVARAVEPSPGLFAWLFGTKAEALTGNTPVPNATVTVYRFDNGAVVGTGQTDANGTYHISVPEGLDVVVMATKGSLRLSALVADVGPQRRRADLSAASTVAAETFAVVHPMGNATQHAPDLRPEDVEPVLTMAEQQLAEVTALDLSLSGGIVPQHFGSGLHLPSGSDLAPAIQAVHQAVPTAVATDVARAKQMVQQLRDAGASVGNAFESELLAQQKMIQDEVIVSFEHTGSPLALIARVFFDPLHVGSGSKQVSTYDVLSLPDGEYQEQLASASAGYPYELVRIGGAPTGQVIIHGAADDPNTAGKTLTVTRSGTGPLPGQPSEVTFAVTSATDAALDYHGSVVLSSSPQSATTTQLTLSASFKDSQVTTPVTLNGTLSGTSSLSLADLTAVAFTELTFSGTLTSAKVNASAGTWTMKFSDTIPSGEMFWDYPTSWTIADLSVETKGTSKTLTLTGDLSAKFTTLSADRSRAQVTQPVATEFNFTGTYTGDTVTSFTGTVTAKWTNPSLDVNTDFPAGTVTVKGEASVSGQSKTTVNLQLTSTNNPNQATLTIAITRGTINLTGTATGQFDSNGDLAQATLTLTNEDGLQIQVTTTDGGDTVTGTVSTSDGTTLATIAVDPDLKQVSIHYSDGTVESVV